MLAAEFRDYRLHAGYYGHVVGILRHPYQRQHPLVDISVVVFPDLGDLDLVVEGGEGDLLVVENLLIEFLAVAKPGILYLDVLRTAHLDHALREVGDPDRITHVEHEDLSAVAHCACLENKLACLRDEHEEADYVGVCDRDGTPCLYLTLEEGYDGAVGAEHVAEAGGDETGRPFHLTLLHGFVKALDVDLTKSLRAAHDVGGVDSLVGGDHHEFLSAVSHGKVGDDAGAVDIVPDALRGIVLHHGDMLVGGCVEDVFRTVVAEDLLHAVSVGYVAHDGAAFYFTPVLRHHQAYVVEGGLSLVYEDQLGRLVGCHLTDHLRSDASRGAGDHDALAAQHLPDSVHVNLDLVAWQEILDVHLLELGIAQVALSVPFHRRRDHLYLYLASDETVNHPAVIADHVALQGGDHYLGGVVPPHLLHEAGVVGEHLHPHHALADHGGIVGDEAGDDVG